MKVKRRGASGIYPARGHNVQPDNQLRLFKCLKCQVIMDQARWGVLGPSCAMTYAVYTAETLYPVDGTYTLEDVTWRPCAGVVMIYTERTDPHVLAAYQIGGPAAIQDLLPAVDAAHKLGGLDAVRRMFSGTHG